MKIWDYKINMGCGQTFLSPEAKKVLGLQLETPSYYPPYWHVEKETIQLIRDIIKTDKDIFILPGSTPFGFEIIFDSFLKENQKLLVVDTGISGRLAYEIANFKKIDVEKLTFKYGKPADIAKIEEKISGDESIKMVMVSHCEEDTGIINDIKAIGEMLKKYSVTFFVDGTTSFCGCPIETDNWGIDILTASSSNCVNAPEGVVILTVGKKNMEEFESNGFKGSSIYSNLHTWICRNRYNQKDEIRFSNLDQKSIFEDFEERKIMLSQYPVVPAILLNALKAALTDVISEGLESTYNKHKVASNAVRAGVKKIGLKVLARDEDAAPMCTTVIPPENIDVCALKKDIYESYGIALGQCYTEKEGLGFSGFQIGTMGIAASPNYVLPTISALENYLFSKKVLNKLGKGLNAAVTIFKQIININGF